MAALLGMGLEAAAQVAFEAAGSEICTAANDNDPGQVVVSGHRPAVERAVKLAAERGAKRAVMLPVSAPFHCALMQPAAEAMAETAYLGGGSVPTQALPTWCVALTPSEKSLDEWSAALRACQPAVVGRVTRDRLLLDLRSVFPRQDAELVVAVESVASGYSPKR